MSNLFSTALLLQATKRADRLTKISASISTPEPTKIAIPSGYDSTTGLFKATTIDGGEVQFAQGNTTAQSNQISVTVASGSLIGFGDWR